MLGEANVVPKESRDFFGRNGDAGVHMMFNFWVNQHLFYALASGDARPLAKAIKETCNIPAAAQWAQFLRNHDELDLGRLDEDQRATVFERFGPEPRMQLYDRGLRRRLAPMLGNRRQLELAYSLLFSLPGTPVMRYGDEIGMGEDLDLRERDAVRTPMQWANEPNGGFSAAEKTVHPAIDDPIWGYQRINVEAQRNDPDSLLNWTARMIRLRKECPEIGWGDCGILKTGSPHVLGLKFTWQGNSLVTLHNFAEAPQEAKIRLEESDDGQHLADLIDKRDSTAEEGVHHVALEAFDYRWYRVGGLNYAIKRGRGQTL
jgi:maltose alpha-D-glucosyltransferase/alpha-amylase